MTPEAEPPDPPDPHGEPEHAPHPLPTWRPSRGFWKQLGAGALTDADRQDLLVLERRLRSTSGNTVRATVLGVNDGLVTNLSLVMGAVGANLAEHVLATGTAGLLAGALSMAMGEWLSVQNARELHQRQLEVEALQILQFPNAEREELERIYRGKGLTPSEAREIAARLMRDKSAVLDVMAREEWGIDPSALGGSAWVAAFASLLSFALGALVPILPFMVLHGPGAIPWSLGVGGAGLVASGAAASRITGRHPVGSALRQLLLGLGAAGATFGILRILGTGGVL